MKPTFQFAAVMASLSMLVGTVVDAGSNGKVKAAAKSSADVLLNNNVEEIITKALLPGNVRESGTSKTGASKSSGGKNNSAKAAKIAANAEQHEQQRKEAVGHIAKQLVQKMDLSKVFKSKACPTSFTAEMCKQAESNAGFYLWLRELRQRALVQQLETETAEHLTRQLTSMGKFLKQ